MYLIGKFYGFLLFENKDGSIQMQYGVSQVWDEKYQSVEEAKNQIRKWKSKKEIIIKWQRIDKHHVYMEDFATKVKLPAFHVQNVAVIVQE